MCSAIDGFMLIRQVKNFVNIFSVEPVNPTLEYGFESKQL